jgi:trimethylamine---corrinoid protein Co-methyltransferase
MSTLIHPLEILTQEQVIKIHETAVRVLAEVGVWLPNQEILELFADHGARVDFDHSLVYIPSDLVEACIQRFPSGFTWYARNPKYSIRLDGTQTHFSFPDSTIRIVDLDGNRREGTAEDGEQITRLCDSLPNMAVASTGVNPPFMQNEVLEAWLMLTMFSKCSKPVYGVCRSARISHMILEIAQIIADCYPHLSDDNLPLAIITNPVSPLMNTPNQLEGMMVYLHRGLPISISPEVQAGATGPATLAGTMVQQTAEFLAHAVIVQLVKPGSPVVYGTVSSTFDMKKMILPYGAPEADLLGIATVQMARFYGIPARTTGGSSDANDMGMQAGVESLMSTLISLQAGSSFVLHGAGEYENTMTMSYEKLLIDEEIIAMARRLIDGIEVTEETLGFEVIKEVGPKGHFLSTDHTLRHYRKEQFMPHLMVRDVYDAWKESGCNTAVERAREKARDILANHQPEPLPEHALFELKKIYESVRQSALIV